MSRKQWELKLEIHAEHPQRTVEVMHDMLQYIDSVISKFSGDGHMSEGDTPLFAAAQMLHPDGFVSVLSVTERYAIADLSHASYHDIVSRRNYSIGNEVRDIEAGQRFKVRANIYYAFAQEWFYILEDKDDTSLPPITKANSELISAGKFAELHHELCVITNRTDWFWNTLISMFQRKASPSRRVRITDVFNMIKDHEDGKTVPF